MKKEEKREKKKERKDRQPLRRYIERKYLICMNHPKGGREDEVGHT